MGKKLGQNQLISSIRIGVLLSLGILLAICPSKPVKSAEEINIIYGPLSFDLSIDSLETYAETGEITRELKFYTKFLSEKDLSQLPNILKRSFKLNQVTVYNLTRLSLAEQLLKELGKIIKTHPERNGFYPIRAALGKAAANPEGWTIIDVMRQFPTETIQIDAKHLLNLRNELANLTNYRQAVIQAIAARAKNEAARSNIDLSQLRDLRQPGSFKFKKETITIEHNTLRQTSSGLKGSYKFDVDLYLPQNTDLSAPLIVISHGFGSLKENFTYLALHLASHGFAVAIPEHVGSNFIYQQALLKERLNTLFSPREYLDRPREISYLLDELERLPNWKKQIDLERVGVVGHSLGTTTALSLAGAKLNTARLEAECDRKQVDLNISHLLQCRASNLPPTNYNLRDPRIKAAIAGMALTSIIFGPEGLGKIEIPTMMVAGSEDIITPVVEEQIHPFIWLKTNSKYLAMLSPGTHFSISQESSSTQTTQLIPQALIGENGEIGRGYLQAASVAFFEVYLRERSEYLPYLSAAYAQSISQKAMSLSLIQSLTPGQLETAYGNPPPKPIVPETVIAKRTPKNESVLDEIKRTGQLKVALRKDAPPFGYLDKEGKWSGYCFDLADSLARHLQKNLDLKDGIELVYLPSSLDDRFELVKNNAVNLECGPNTIRTDVEKVTFSEPFFITGTHFLAKSSFASQFKAGGKLVGIKTGVLKKTTTEQFIKKNYPQTKTVYFQGPAGTTEAVKALVSGKIDLFANDGILSLAQIEVQNLNRESYVLLPKVPLTCDYYGLILPDGDRKWRNTVNSFLREEKTAQVWEKWFTDLFPYVLLNLDYCLNLSKTP